MNSELALINFAKKAEVQDVICLGCHHYKAMYGKRPAYFLVRDSLKIDARQAAELCAPILGVILNDSSNAEVMFLDESMKVRYWV
jgi:hypothetical protein